MAATARLAAAAAATALAVTSRGDITLLAVALGLAAADPLVGLTAAMAGVAVAVRWGSTSLESVAGAQAVVGPAGWTGRGAAVVAMWFAAAALLLAARPLADEAFAGLRSGRWSSVVRLAPTVPFGVAAATVVVGSAPGGAVGRRVVASVVLAVTAGLVAMAVGVVVRRFRLGWARQVAPAACATLAVVGALAA
ncbi:MAG: hypothetical protein ACRD29_16125 [Acidimicrobiales bacterium]